MVEFLFDELFVVRRRRIVLVVWCGRRVNTVRRIARFEVRLVWLLMLLQLDFAVDDVLVGFVEIPLLRRFALVRMLDDRNVRIVKVQVRIAHELVNVAFAANLLHYAFFVVVAQRSAQLVVVHGLSILLGSPLSCNFLRIAQLERRLLPAHPLNDVGLIRVEQVNQELPELQSAAFELQRALVGVVGRCVLVDWHFLFDFGHFKK